MKIDFTIMCQFHVKNTFFPESCGLLNLLKKKRPGRVPDNPEIKASNDGDHNKSGSSANATLEIANTNNNNNTSGGSADLLGLGKKMNTMRRDLNPKFSRNSLLVLVTGFFCKNLPT